MRTIDYSQILAGVSALMTGGTVDDLAPEDFAAVRSFSNRRLQVAWEINEWPDVCRVEQRYFRPFYSATETMALGVERYYPVTGRYYQALQAGTGNAPALANGTPNYPYWAESATSYCADLWVTATVYAVGAKVRNPANGSVYICIAAHTAGASFDATKFALLTPFNRYIAYAQSGETVIGEVFQASDRNPNETTRLCGIPFGVSADGFQIYHNVASVWIRFRIQCPLLSGETFDATKVYTSGRQVLFTNTTTGVINFYDCLASTNPGESPLSAADKWQLVEIPYVFGKYLVQAIYADWLKSDGQADKAASEETMSLNFLELEADKLHRQQKQTSRLNYRS